MAFILWRTARSIAFRKSWSERVCLVIANPGTRAYAFKRSQVIDQQIELLGFGVRG